MDYTISVNNGPQDLNGLQARGIFDLSGTTLTIQLINTSTGVPTGFDVSDSLLTSLGMNLADAAFVVGTRAEIAAGSVGVGSLSGAAPGESVADEWVWTNEAGGDFLAQFPQVITTSRGFGGGTAFHFLGGSGNISGPFGGIAAAPPIVPVPDTQAAASDAIVFELELSGTLTPEQLRQIALTSVVEFGSDRAYLGVPEPGSLLLLAGALGLLCRRIRHL